MFGTFCPAFFQTLENLAGVAGVAGVAAWRENIFQTPLEAIRVNRCESVVESSNHWNLFALIGIHSRFGFQPSCHAEVVRRRMEIFVTVREVERKFLTQDAFSPKFTTGSSTAIYKNNPPSARSML
jgi:hypothetical protein